MWEKTNPFRIRLKTVFYLFAILLALASVTPVLADYLGPNRTVSESTGDCKIVLATCRYVAAKGIWKYTNGTSWSCGNESKPWLAYPSTSRSCSNANSGYTYWRKVDNSQQQIVTYPSATIDSSLQDCSPNNGWCTSAQLFLSADEPVAGYEILAVEGALNGQNFACPNSECSVPLVEGQNDLVYWALSSWGDSSTMGSLSIKVDSQLPVISGTFNGTMGSNDWHISPVSFNGSASDATSGLASFTCTLDDIPLGSCNSVSVNDEGPHTLVLKASDNAGNSSVVSKNISIDTQPPALSSSLQGIIGSNSWYNDAELHASATDSVPGSGLSLIEYSIDSTGWIIFPSTGILDLPEGKHSVDVRATDNAGHSAASSKSFWLDSVAPNLTLTPQGTLGTNDWYVTSLNLTASVNEDTSGLDILEYTHNGSTWTTYTAPLLLTDGSHNVAFWAQDKAGLVTQVNRVYQVDTAPPQIAGSISGTPGTNGWYVSNVTLSASAADPLPGSGIEAFTYIQNNGVETPYTSALTILDGVHTIRLNVQDKAGLTFFTEQSVKVDTIHPSLTIGTTLPNWVKEKVTLTGAANDEGSGLSKIEISTDGGHSWKAVNGTTSWNYEWDTTGDTNGLHNVIVRAVDQAGLTSQQAITTGVDNQTPTIVLPASWLQWQTVTLDVWDNESGLSEARVEISDPNGRWPKRTINLDSAQFPLNFKWDRRFGDNTVAPNGNYDVTITAIDQLGNVSQQHASVRILIDLLPAGPTATPQPYYRITPTPILTLTPIPSSMPAATSTIVVNTFGQIQPTPQVTSTPETVIVPRATPTQTGLLEWLESVLIPDANFKEATTPLETSGFQAASTDTPATESTVLWGAAAAAMIGSVTAYALEEKRKREQGAEKQAVEPNQSDPQASKAALAERKARIRAKQMKRLEAQWALESTRETKGSSQKTDSKSAASIINAHPEFATKATDAKIDRSEAPLPAAQKKVEVSKTAEQTQRSEQLQDRVENYREERKKAEAVTPESNWWEKTKSFVSDNIVKPFDQYIYEPIVQPAVEKRNEILANTASWLNKNVYQPYIAPKVDNALDDLKNNFSKFNETVIQPWVIPFFKEVGGVISDAVGFVTPYIAPIVAKGVEWGKVAVTWFNESVYQPSILPALKDFNENVYQPYLSPMVDVGVKAVNGYIGLVTEYIYEPIFSPIVNDINKYIVKPYVDPAVEWFDKTWDEYGEWVHNGLDAVGFIPGLGDIMDGINGAIYLAEGRYLEASISMMSMLPVLGDLAKGGKLGLKVSTEVIEEGVEKVAKEFAEEVAEKTTKEIAEETLEKAAAETGEELIEQTAKEFTVEAFQKTAAQTTEELAEKATKETLENVAEKTAKETTEELSSKVLKQSVENNVQNVVQKTTKDVTTTATNNAAETMVSATSERTSKEIKEQLVQQALEKVDDKTAKIIRSLEKSLGDDVLSLEKGIKLLERHGDAAVKALNGVNLEAAQKMLKTLDDDVLDFAVKEGSGAFEALSRWPKDDLLEHGVELALRAKKDALVLEATRKLVALGPFDPAHITSKQRKLINQIAENSVIYGDEAQAVIGKYAGVNGGFLELAKKTGSLHYSPHPDVWNTLEKLGVENQKKVAWLVNQQAIQTGISKGLPFEYGGVTEEIFEKEAPAIRKMFTGGTEKEVMELLESPYTFRMMELQELQKAGYDITFYKDPRNILAKSYILAKP